MHTIKYKNIYDKTLRIITFAHLVSRIIHQTHLAPMGAPVCDYGVTITRKECEAIANGLAKAAGRTPRRILQVWGNSGCLDGDWGQVPMGCSVQTGGDWTAYYKTSDTDSGDNCKNTLYQLVCKLPDLGISTRVCFIFS